jgi:hypothetical protein
MILNEFKKLLSRRPFQPFRVVMSSGEMYEVRHPETALLTRHTLYIGTDFDREGIPEESAMCSLIHVASVEPVTNGRQKRR